MGYPLFIQKAIQDLNSLFVPSLQRRNRRNSQKKDGNPPVLYLFLESEFLSGEPVGRGLDPAVVPVWVTRRSKRRARAVRFPYVGPNRMDIKKNILLP